MKTRNRLFALLGAVAMLAAMTPLAGSAHESREIADGQFEMVVGFSDEPAFVGLKNGLDLTVTIPDEGEGAPVEGLFDTLEAEVIYGDQTMELELEPAYGEPGAYQSIFFPTATAAYTFRIFGEIEGVEIDESFTSGPETFSEVNPIEPLMFPMESGSSQSVLDSPYEIALASLLLVGGAALFYRQRQLAPAAVGRKSE